MPALFSLACEGLLPEQFSVVGVARSGAYRVRLWLPALRRSAAIRGMVRETRLAAQQLIVPLFVTEGTQVRREVSSMPGVFQMSVDVAVPWLAQRADVSRVTVRTNIDRLVGGAGEETIIARGC